MVYKNIMEEVPERDHLNHPNKTEEGYSQGKHGGGHKQEQMDYPYQYHLDDN